MNRQHCRCLLNRHSGCFLFFSCERHVLCDQVTSNRVADPESIAPVGGLSSRNRVRTALGILQVGLSTRRVPQFLPVYSAWRVRLCVSCCCRSPASTKTVRYPSAGPSPYRRRHRWFETRGTAPRGSWRPSSLPWMSYFPGIR